MFSYILSSTGVLLVGIFQGDVIENTELTQDVYIVKFRLDKNIEFKAGQFVNIEIPLPDGKKMKPYSIASPPIQRNVLEFCIKRVPGGLVSNYLHDIEIGTKLKIMGPFGMFTLKENKDADSIFVATGTGIAGVKPMIEDLLSNGYKKNVYLIFGVRFENDVYYKQLFEELAKKHKNFFFVPTLSKPDAKWAGEKGYVQEWIKKHV